MRLPRTPEFDEECARFSLRFCCEDCAHWERADERCRHEWPNERHLRSQPSEWVDFCKEFELC